MESATGQNGRGMQKVEGIGLPFAAFQELPSIVDSWEGPQVAVWTVFLGKGESS